VAGSVLVRVCACKTKTFGLVWLSVDVDGKSFIELCKGKTKKMAVLLWAAVCFSNSGYCYVVSCVCVVERDLQKMHPTLIND